MLAWVSWAGTLVFSFLCTQLKHTHSSWVLSLWAFVLKFTPLALLGLRLPTTDFGTSQPLYCVSQVLIIDCIYIFYWFHFSGEPWPIQTLLDGRPKKFSLEVVKNYILTVMWWAGGFYFFVWSAGGSFTKFCYIFTLELKNMITGNVNIKTFFCEESYRNYYILKLEST